MSLWRCLIAHVRGERTVLLSAERPMSASAERIVEKRRVDRDDKKAASQCECVYEEERRLGRPLNCLVSDQRP